MHVHVHVCKLTFHKYKVHKVRFKDYNNTQETGERSVAANQRETRESREWREQNRWRLEQVMSRTHGSKLIPGTLLSLAPMRGEAGPPARKQQLNTTVQTDRVEIKLQPKMN